MKLRAYALRDVKADSYGAPFFVPGDGIAQRLLSDMVLDRRTDVGRYPQDFALYCIGQYDNQSGELSACQPEHICSASACLPKPDPRQTVLPGVDVEPEVVR